MINILENKIYLVVSKWAYPFGGGEEFLLQTMDWAKRLKMKTYWICFSDAKNEDFSHFILEVIYNGIIIKLPGGINETVIKNWLILLKPDIVHHQGHLRLSFYNCCEKVRTEFLSGFHFWHGAIILDAEKKNTNIIENYEYHRTDEELVYLYGRKYCNLYCVTPFVSQCIKKITGYDIPENIYSSPSYEKLKIENLDVTQNKYVTMVNIHKMKGGELFLYLIENCKDISFLGVKTEYGSEELDKLIEDAAIKRVIDGNKQCLIINRVANPKIIYQQSRIVLVPTLADETFCRVMNEAMMNGIPILTTGMGNTKNLLRDSGYIIPFENKDEYVKVLNELYFNEDLLKEQSAKTLNDYEMFSEKRAFKLFKNSINKHILHSKEMNIMIFTPWCDQGLGIQSRNYANILKNTNYNVSIFALKPYCAETCIELQKNPKEWEIENIYYSFNDREHVTDNEIINFVKQYNIGKCLLPETCWFRVFEVAKLLRKLNVKCYAIPNIEIVRKDEIYKHRYFYKILCNNYLCEKIFNSYDILSTQYIGYGINDNDIQFRTKTRDDVIKFLFIGGMNAFSRKHILEICEAFSSAYNHNDNICLTCTIQKINLLEQDDQANINKYLNHPGINIIQSHMKYTDIISLYHEHHVSVQVSKHEGLGLGFYESLATGTPVITLDTPPHNEIILNEINGWVIPCTYKPMTDNKDPLFDSAYFDPEVLAKKFSEIANNFNDKYFNVLSNLLLDYTQRLHINKFEELFLKAIN